MSSVTATFANRAASAGARGNDTEDNSPLQPHRTAKDAVSMGRIRPPVPCSRRAVSGPRQRRPDAARRAGEIPASFQRITGESWPGRDGSGVAGARAAIFLLENLAGGI